jgi:Ca2+-binding RTX toxin-like protein
MIEWKIANLFATLSNSEVDQQRPNGAIVVRAEWQVTGRDQNITASVTGFQEFVYDPTTEFTPYLKLTEEQVLSWVHRAMAGQRKAYEDMVMQQVAQKKAEPITLPLPWHQPAPIMVEQPSGNDTLIGGNGNDSLGGLV